MHTVVFLQCYVAHHNAALYKIAQLTDVARPVVLQQFFKYLRRKLTPDSIGLLKLFQKALGQGNNVLPAFPKGRKVKGEYIESIVEVGTEGLSSIHLVRSTLVATISLKSTGCGLTDPSFLIDFVSMTRSSFP